LKNDYETKIVDPSDNNKLIELTNGYFLINDLKDSSYQFEFRIFEKNSTKVVATETFNINTTASISYIQETYEQKFLLTHNSDDTSNIYYQKTNLGLDENLLKRELNLLNGEDEKLLYTANEAHENVLEIIDIAENSYSILEKIYFTENKVDYLVYQAKSSLLEMNKTDIKITAEQSYASIDIQDKVISDINVRLTFNDLNTVKTYVVSKDDYQNEILIEYDQPSSDVDINVQYTKDTYSTIIEPSFTYKGDIGKRVTYTENFKFNLKSELRLENIEFMSHNLSYLNETYLYLDGYLLPNEYAAVEIKNSTSDIIYSLGYIKSLPKTIYISDIPVNEELSITYITYYEETTPPGVDLEGTMEYPFNQNYAINTSLETEFVTFNLNNEYDSLYSSTLVTFETKNADEYYITVNEDQTVNAYVDANLTNNSSYDVYLKTSLVPTFSESKNITQYSKDGLILFENISNPGEENLQYGIEYELVIFEDNYTYKISSIEYGTGYIGTITNNKYFIGYELHSILVDSRSTYQIETNYEIVSDITVNIILDYENHVDSFVIPLESVLNPEKGIIEVNLSSYSPNYCFEIGLEMDVRLNSFIENSSFINSFNIKGTTLVRAIGSANIYI
jgi:hypothetical protein